MNYFPLWLCPQWSKYLPPKSQEPMLPLGLCLYPMTQKSYTKAPATKGPTLKNHWEYLVLWNTIKTQTILFYTKVPVSDYSNSGKCIYSTPQSPQFLSKIEINIFMGLKTSSIIRPYKSWKKNYIFSGDNGRELHICILKEMKNIKRERKTY